MVIRLNPIRVDEIVRKGAFNGVECLEASFNAWKDLGDMDARRPVARVVPYRVVLMPTGTRDDKPSFIFMSMTKSSTVVASECSEAMLTKAFADVGYELKKKPKIEVVE